MAMQEERFSLGENSYHMVTATPFNANLKVHVRPFYVNGNGEMKASRIGITLSVEEFNELVKLIPKIKDSITLLSSAEARVTNSNNHPILRRKPLPDATPNMATIRGNVDSKIHLF